jgi:hypothetical protein
MDEPNRVSELTRELKTSEMEVRRSGHQAEPKIVQYNRPTRDLSSGSLILSVRSDKKISGPFHHCTLCLLLQSVSRRDVQRTV